MSSPAFESITSHVSLLTASATESFSHTVASASERLLLVKVIGDGSIAFTVLGVTYGGVGLTRLGGSTPTSSHKLTDIWYMVAPTVGTATLAVTLSTNFSNLSEETTLAENYSNVAQGSPLGSIAQSSANTGSPSISVTGVAGDLITDCAITNANLAVGAGQTERYRAACGTEFAGSSTIVAVGASTTMQWTTASTNWSSAGVAIKVGTGSEPDLSTSKRLTALDAISIPALEDLLYTVDDPSGLRVSNKVTAARFFGFTVRGICDGRLTTLTTVPISTADRTAQSTIYFTPYLGSKIALYDGTRWELFTFTEISLALSGLTSGKNYDVFVYSNSGTLTLELSAAWSADTTRTDALTTQDGVQVKSGATTRRYLGTIRTTGTTTTEDSRAKRFVWNMYNRVPRILRAVDATSSWTYGTATWRQANAGAGNQVDLVVGQIGCLLHLNVLAGAVSNQNNHLGFVSIGEDSTTTPHTDAFWMAHTAGGGTSNSQQGLVTSALRITVTLGRHYYAWLEATNGVANVTFVGTSASSPAQYLCGIAGTVDA